jgi:hypothetical protein
MSLSWTKHCPENGQIHSTSQLYCPHCSASQDETAPPVGAPRTRPSHLNCVANVEREVVNHRLRTAQSSRSNAGSSALSTRPPNGLLQIKVFCHILP